MTEEIIIAGFGGQGVLSMGKILAYSGMMQNKEVSWMPSYGPEMRGGTANVTVIISDNRISSPVLHEFDTAILLNQQSITKFEGMVKPGGVLIYDGNGIVNPPTRNDISIFRVDASEEAVRSNMQKTFNMIVMGAYMKVKPIVHMDDVLKGLKSSLPVRHHHLLPSNEIAIEKGMEIVRQISTPSISSKEGHENKCVGCK